MRQNAFNERARRAHLARQAAIGQELEQDEVGRQVARYLGAEEPIGQGTVSRWFRSSVPDLRTIAALALVLNVDPGWLAFGELSGAPKPHWANPGGGNPGGASDVEAVETVEAAERLSQLQSEKRKPRGA